MVPMWFSPRRTGPGLHVDAVTFVPGCTAEEDPEAVGFDELGRITAVMHDHARGWTVPSGFTRFPLGPGDHSGTGGPLG